VKLELIQPCAAIFWGSDKGPTMIQCSLKLTFLCFFAVLGFSAEGPGRKFTTPERFERNHLEAVRRARDEWAAARKTPPGTGIYQDFRAVMHVHAEDSNHTGGTRPEVLAAARKTGVRVVMFTDHRGPKPETWRGLRDGILFMAGSEEEGLLRFPLFDPVSGAVSGEDLRFICHIEERYDVASSGYDGMEIYNRHTDTKDDLEFNRWWVSLIKDKERWTEFEKNYKEFPDEIFAAGTDYWPEIFQKWDSETKVRQFTGIGANDAHQNQVFNGLMIDPYEVSFRNLSTHILARELSEKAVRQSLREGHVYVSHDWLCDPEGFLFVAANNLGVFNMGDSGALAGTTKLIAQTPVSARIRLFHNGTLKEEQTGERVTFETKAEGTYRVEAWLQVDSEERPWIYSNPIYLRRPDLLSLQLPSFETPATVEVKKDIQYVEGETEDASKHQLDLYLPKDKTNFPVFLFLHGGAWKSGDRKQYPPLGNRYAREGVATVVPSYRLAPKNAHPAQITDAAAALVWVLKNIAAFGGDTNRIFVGGHSAGGHLAALLALDVKYLNKHGLSPQLLRGVIALSGVYDLSSESQEKVFGTDKNDRIQASPVTHIRKDVPPFLITYCEWDYFPLARQAQDFQSALTRSGASAEIVFVPKENHISEMLAVSRDDDLTVESVLRFIRSR
jgi:acetyl esterase/lipase